MRMSKALHRIAEDLPCGSGHSSGPIEGPRCKHFSCIAMLLVLTAAFVPRSSARESTLLHEHNFFKVASSGRWLILFHAPQCGACQAFQPLWEELSKKADGAGLSGTRLGMVDATAEEQLAAKHGIEGYPTLLLIEDGLMAEYLGPREEDAIIAFVKAGFTDELKERAVAAPGPPSWLDPIWELSTALHEIRSVACSSSALFAAAMVWLCLALGFGVIIGLASARSEPAFFTAVCPPGLGPAETVAVSIPSRSWWGAHSRTVHVTPPPGIREGQPFFVPLRNSAVRGQVVRKKSV